MRITKIFASTILLALSTAAFSASPSSFKQLVVFGDSYSDNGNTYQVSDNTYPGKPYYLGRFSNGLNWTEYLASRMGLDFMNAKVFRNYAYGQAQVLGDVSLSTHAQSDPKKTWTFSVPDLKNQITQYQKQGVTDSNNVLYVIFIGTNDFLNHNPGGRPNNAAFITQWFNALQAQVTRLQTLGATHIVLFTVRDLQQSPLAKSLAKKYKDDYIARLNAMISHFNALMLAEYKSSQTVKIYDVYAFDQQLFSQVAPYKWYREHMDLTEKTTACYANQGNYVDDMGPSCNDAWGYVYYDRIHFTTAANKLMSDDVYEWLRFAWK